MGSLHSQNARISLSCLGRSGERSCLRMVGPIGSALVSAFGLKSTCANEPSPKRIGGICNRSASRRRRVIRSEEHTSELQSHLNLVCRLLLEKKKSYTRVRGVAGPGHTTCQ